MSSINYNLFFFLNDLSHKSVFFDRLIVFFADIFPYIVIVLAFLFLIFHHEVSFSKNSLKEILRKGKEIFLVFFASGFAWLLAHLFKNIFRTLRPFDLFSQIVPLFSESGFAFPSGHATFFTALAFAIFFYHKKVGYIFMFFAFLISLSRIIGGVHFPIDILGGFVLGFAIAFFLKKMYLQA